MSFLWPSHDDLLCELLERARGGDRSAFRALYLELYDPVAKYVGRRVGRGADAEDVVARVFHKLLEGLGEFASPRGTVRMFVFAIARNVVIDHFRAARPGVPLDELSAELTDETGTPLEALVQEEDLREVRAALLDLPAEVREMVALRYGDGLKHAAIAELLGMQVDAVKQRLSRALRTLRAKLVRGPAPPGDGHEAAERADEPGAKGAMFHV